MTWVLVFVVGVLALWTVRNTLAIQRIENEWSGWTRANIDRQDVRKLEIETWREAVKALTKKAKP